MHNPVSRAAPQSSSGYKIARRFGLCLLLGTLLLVTGCGGGGKGLTNSVSGKVTLGDKNVAGTVYFVYSDKETVAPIGVDGMYTMSNPPAGQVKILVKGDPGRTVAPPVKGGPEMPSMGGASQGVNPPAKYASPATSDLTYEVKTGKQTKDLELKP